MLLTAAPYTIKGAAFDCLKDAILEGGETEKKRRTVREKKKALPLCSRQTPECSRPRGSTFSS